MDLICDIGQSGITDADFSDNLNELRIFAPRRKVRSSILIIIVHLNSKLVKHNCLFKIKLTKHQNLFIFLVIVGVITP